MTTQVAAPLINFAGTDQPLSMGIPMTKTDTWQDFPSGLTVVKAPPDTLTSGGGGGGGGGGQFAHPHCG